MGWISIHPIGVLSSPPSGGRGRPPGCCPAPWPVASVIFHNPVVGHTRKQVCGVVVARIHPRTWTLYGSLGSPNHSRGVVTLKGRSVARRAPLRMMGSWARRIGVASEAISPRRHGGRRGPIGVVKLLRARGGCLGVIRWRAWKAAKGPGELPNERRSRNTRWRPGELKHLSTRRNRNQPRLPQ
jgi:hypothetical protein